MVQRVRADYTIGLRDRTGPAFRNIRGNLRLLNTTFRGLSRAAALGFGALGIGGGIAGFTALAKSAGTTAKAISEVSKRVGISAEALQRLVQVARSEGTIEFREFGNLLTRLVRNVNRAALGSKELGQHFERLGLNVKSLQGLNPEEQFLTFADAVANTGDQGVALAATMGVLESEGRGLFTTLRLGRTTIQQMGQEAQASGKVINNDLIASGAELDQAFQDVADTIGTSLKRAVLNLSPEIIKLLDLVEQLSLSLSGAEDLSGLVPSRSASARAAFEAGPEIARLTQPGRALSPRELLAGPGATDTAIRELRDAIVTFTEASKREDALIERRRTVDQTLERAQRRNQRLFLPDGRPIDEALAGSAPRGGSNRSLDQLSRDSSTNLRNQEVMISIMRNPPPPRAGN